MKHIYFPQGTCSTRMEMDISEDGVVTRLQIDDGCDGNLQGLARLTLGRKAAEIISALKGIRCGFGMTSCPDQLATALLQAMQESGLELPAESVRVTE